MIADKPISEITEADLKALVTGSQREGVRIEFKRDQYEWNDAGTREFLADVSSFANAHGGLLLVGIDEADACAADVRGVEGDVDGEILRMNAKIQSAIDPRIIGTQIRAVPLSSGRHVLAIRIPQSWGRPHVVVFKNYWRFFSRNSGGKYQLDVTELRSLFEGAASVSERIGSFRLERLNDIQIGSTPTPLEEGAKLLLHVIPLSSFEPGFTVPLPGLDETNELRKPLMSAGYSWRYNFDGLLTFTNRREKQTSTYLQIFRNGILEAVDCRLLRPWEGQLSISDLKFEKELLEAVARYQQLIDKMGLMPPMAWALTLTGVKGYYMAVGRYGSGRDERIERDTLLVPLVLQEEVAVPPESITKKLVDPIWQACGWEESRNFSDAGAWTGHA